MTDLDDVSLLRRWRAGDSAAGSRLVERHFQTVYRFFRRKFDDPGIAKDLSQQTFLTCLEKRDQLRDDLRFKAFVLGIARNVLLRRLRTLGQDAERAQRGQAAPTPTATSPSRVVEMREEHKLLLAALRGLPHDLQMTLELHYWEELTTREVGEILEIPAGTVKWRLSRARELLKAAIEELAASRALAESTVGNLDHWARSLREVVPADPDPEA